MRLFDQLKKVADLLSEYPNQWAVCGGVAASIYRNRPRFTDDIDIALIDSEKISAQELASSITKALGYKEFKGFVPDIKNSKQQLFGLIAGREENDARFIGIDFLLPVQFWIQKSVELAQSNLIDYGFAQLPTITPESLLIAKVAAFIGSPERLVDLDDINEIVKSIEIDKEYVLRELEKQQLAVPKSVLEALK